MEELDFEDDSVFDITITPSNTNPEDIMEGSPSPPASLQPNDVITLIPGFPESFILLIFRITTVNVIRVTIKITYSGGETKVIKVRMHSLIYHTFHVLLNKNSLGFSHE